MSLRYIVAPYEADAQIVFLVQNGYADFAISEDSDLLAYGCSKVSELMTVYIFCVSTTVVRI